MRDDSGPRVQEVVTVIESDEDIARLSAHAHIRAILEMLPEDSKEKVGDKAARISVEDYHKQKADEQEAREQADRKAQANAEKEALKAELLAELEKGKKAK